ARLLGTIRRTSGDDRDQARLHLVSLFEVFPPGDPRVARARGALSSLLFLAAAGASGPAGAYLWSVARGSAVACVRRRDVGDAFQRGQRRGQGGQLIRAERAQVVGEQD